jgi:hypothetical protein
VAVPLDRFEMVGDDLVLNAVTEEELESMPEFDETMAEPLELDMMVNDAY